MGKGLCIWRRRRRRFHMGIILQSPLKFLRHLIAQFSKTLSRSFPRLDNATVQFGPRNKIATNLFTSPSIFQSSLRRLFRLPFLHGNAPTLCDQRLQTAISPFLVRQDTIRSPYSRLCYLVPSQLGPMTLFWWMHSLRPEP